MSNMEINIIGKGNGWNVASGDVMSWGVNNVCLRRDVDVIFNMHDLESAGQIGSKKVVKTIEYAKHHNIPVVTIKEFESIPTSIRFPIEEMHCKYFTNSIAYMIAYAVHVGATKINIFGVNILGGEEYTEQKPCIEYWMGYARGKGIEVFVQEPTRLAKARDDKMYGYGKEQW